MRRSSLCDLENVHAKSASQSASARYGHSVVSQHSRDLDNNREGWYLNRGGFGEIMRRRLEALIPIVLLAIMVQLLAPIAAFRAVAYASADPLYMSSICSGMVSSEGDQTAPARTQHDHGDCCAFCAAGHGGALAVNPPSPVFVSLQRLYQRVSWLEANDPLPAVRVGSNAQARAPPQLT